MRPDKHSKAKWVYLSCFAIVFITWGNSLYIHAKALLAQHLISAAWSERQAGSKANPPWPWADTRPIGRLKSETLDTDLYILAGSSGTSLAFGPGHVEGTALPGELGTTVIGGHRDTHFSFLQHIKLGDELQMQDANGHWLNYSVTQTQIMDTRDGELQINPDDDGLILITCYPFNAINPGGNLRYVVHAQKETNG